MAKPFPGHSKHNPTAAPDSNSTRTPRPKVVTTAAWLKKVGG